MAWREFSELNRFQQDRIIQRFAGKTFVDLSRLEVLERRRLVFKLLYDVTKAPDLIEMVRALAREKGDTCPT